MKKMLLVLAAALTLSGCIAFDDMYDEHARDECDRETNSPGRGDCYDRIEQNRREHR